MNFLTKLLLSSAIAAIIPALEKHVEKALHFRKDETEALEAAGLSDSQIDSVEAIIIAHKTLQITREIENALRRLKA